VAAAPGFSEANTLLGIILFHVALLEESAREFERSLAIDPGDLYAFLHLGFCHYLQGDWRRALDISQETWRRAPSAWAGYQIALARIQMASLDEAERTAELTRHQFPDDVLYYPLGGLIAALRGDRAKALRQIDLTVENRKAFGHYHHAQYDLACISAILGRPEDSMTWPTEAAGNGFPCHTFFEHDPLLAGARTDAAFAPLIERLRVQGDRCRGIYRELGRKQSA
jgi:tetratricopeptide (TPR) repeat protein